MFVYVRNHELSWVLARSIGVSLVFRGVRWSVSGDLVLVGIQAGEQSREGWAAQSSRHIPPTEQGAFRGQLVKVRGLDVIMPHEAVIGVALIIGKDQDDVGGLGMDRVCEHD
jgi:hypothetical protein